MQIYGKFCASAFAQKPPQAVPCPRVSFNYETETWRGAHLFYPNFENDFVLLTPKDMLTRDEAWINKDDLYHDFEIVCEAVPNEQLRAQINNYFMKVLPEEASLRQKRRAMVRTIRKYPQLIDAYIRFKEKRGGQAIRKSSRKVKLSEQMYLENFGELAELLHKSSGFYGVGGATYKEA